jgi:hypothetical protein
MIRTDDLKLGQRFRAEDGLLWELERFAYLTTNIPHVSLVYPRDRTVHKIIAKSVLLDRRRFTFMERSRDI